MCRVKCLMFGAGIFLLSLLAGMVLAYPSYAITYYYVDPTYVGGSNDGSPARPWTSVGSSQWSTINSNLASDDVMVYFSARKASSDVDEDYGTDFELKRTSTSTRRLTLNGRSKYNTNESLGSWSDYTGSSKMQFHSPSYGLKCFSGGGKQNYITVDGFKMYFTGTSGARFGVYYWGGDYVELLNNTLNPGGIYFEYAYYLEPRTLAGRCRNITIGGNTIANPLGEGLYFGGAGDTSQDAHYNVTIENNVVHNCGSTSGQGDGIDIKNGITGLLVRGNISYSNGLSGNRGNGIVSMSPGIFEKNKCYNNTASGIMIDSYWPAAGTHPWPSTDTIIVRNNVVYSNVESGIKINKSNNVIYSPTQVYNNSLYNNGAGGSIYSYGIIINGIPSLALRNNVSYYTTSNSGYECGITNVTSLTQSNNNFFGGAVVGCNPGLFANPNFTGADNLYPQSSSPLINTGAALDTFSSDVAGTLRPQGSAWDIGAYEYLQSTGTPPSAPQNFRVVPPK